MASNRTIKIPTKVYVGFQNRPSSDDVPLGFMTPWGEDEAAKKRIATVNNWARGYGNTTPIEPVTLNNIPMTGFRISRAVRRSGGWGSSNATFVRVEDPRGFELEISVQNLLMLMDNNITQDAEIIQECIWGRDGGNNILLAVNSQPYLDATENTRRSASKVSAREVKPGFEVTVENGDRGFYYGIVNAVLKKDGNLHLSEKRYHLMRIRNSAGQLGNFSLYKSCPKFSYVHSTNAMTPAEVEQFVSSEATTVKIETAFHDWRSPLPPVVSVVTKGFEIVSRTTEDTTVEALRELIKDKNYGRFSFQDDLSLVTYRLGEDTYRLYLSMIKVDDIKTKYDAWRTKFIATPTSSYGGYWGRSNTRYPDPPEFPSTTIDGKVIDAASTIGFKIGKWDGSSTIPSVVHAATATPWSWLDNPHSSWNHDAYHVNTSTLGECFRDNLVAVISEDSVVQLHKMVIKTKNDIEIKVPL